MVYVGLLVGRSAGDVVCMILALDLGTRTGWACSQPEVECSQVESGWVSFAAKSQDGDGMRYLMFRRWLNSVLNAGDISAVYYEDVARHAGTKAAHAYGGYKAILTSWCEAHLIPYTGVAVGTIKKHATGKGNATKDEMIVAAKVATNRNITDDNEADAICLLQYALEQEGANEP